MMHNYSWHGGFFSNEHMWGMWIWPTGLIVTIAIVVYLAVRVSSKLKEK